MVSSENTTGMGPDPIDPLVDYSSLSLFPLSFKPQSSIQDDRNPNLPSIDSLHSHLKSLVLKSPEKLLKQAKIILGDSLDPLKTDKTSDMGHMAYQDKAEAGFARNGKNPQEKRPALGLKRAKFSAKPIPRQLDVMLEPSIDIDKLDDPEEYFAAMERMENAKKELQRLRGEPLMDLNQNLPPLSPRHRRPSLLGKSATYRHRSYSSSTTDQYGETLSSSQKTSEHHALSPSCQEVLSATNTMNFSPKTRVSDPVPMETGKLSELDELLSLDYEGLDEADVVNLLGDKLDIKIRDIGKTSLPDIYDVRPRKSVPSGEASSKIKDKISTNLHGMMKSTEARLLRGGSQSKDSVVPSQTSSKSPLASISLLNRHISKLAALKDPFSLDIDSSPARSSPPETQHQRQSDLVDVRMDLSESCLKHGEERTAVGCTSVSAAIDGENGTTTTVNPEERFDDVSQSDQAGTRKDVHEFELSTVPGEESDAVSGRDWPTSLVKVISPTSEPKRWEDGVSQFDQVGTREELCELMNSPAHKDERIADECEGSPVFPARDADSTSQDDQREDEMVEVGHSAQQINVEGFHMEKSIANVEGCGVGEASNVEDFCAEEPTKEKGGSTKRKLGGQKVKAQSKAKQSKEPVKKGSKETTMSTTPVSEKTGKKRRKVEDASPKRSKEKELRQRRQSLYDCGTRWEAGIRRSTRIRMRPLEYWRGERFLYGRVHNSLVTVIGVKYASPSKEAEKPAVKVKSFVSDEYKDLVDSAALH